MPAYLNVQPPDLAAIVPLDYGNGREEMSLIYSSHDWTKLTEMLANPTGFFQEQANDWHVVHAAPKGAEAAKDWKLLPPTTVILQWAGRNRRALARTAGTLCHGFVETGDQGRLEDLHAVAKDFGDTTEVISTLDGVFDSGVFVAEYAFNTRSLFVRYHPPVALRTGLEDKGEFTGKFTSATVNILPPAVPSMPSASLHIDIGQTPEHRATFTKEFLQNCAPFLQYGVGQSDEFFSGDVPMIARKGTIDVQKIDPGTRPLVQMPEDKPFPSVVMEVNSDPIQPAGPSDCLVCVFSEGAWHKPASGPTVFFPDNTVVKCYVP